MKTLNLRQNPDLNQKLLEEYFDLKWKQKIKKEAFLKVSVLSGIIFIFLFFVTKNPFWATAFLCSLSFVLYSAIHFFHVKRQYIQKMKENKTKDFEFSYSENGIKYKTEDIESSVAWSHFKFYELNGKNIYLYNKSGLQMIEIISERIAGKESFEEMKSLIENHVKKK